MYDNLKLFKRIKRLKIIYLILIIALSIFLIIDSARLIMYQRPTVLWYLECELRYMIFIVLLIIQLVRLQLSDPQTLLRFSPANAVVSLICSVTPIILMLPFYFIAFAGGSDVWMVGFLVFFVYYSTIGIPITFLWLICGYIGLKTNKRALVFAGLLLKIFAVLAYLLLIVSFH